MSVQYPKCLDPWINEIIFVLNTLENVPVNGDGFLPLGLVSKNDCGECNTARNEVLNIARLAFRPAKLNNGEIGGLL
jgi:hypothetical protein